MLFCPECGFLGAAPASGRVANQFRYCPRCGKESLVNGCPECKSAICYEEQKYCMSCGAPLQRELGRSNHPDHGARE